MSKRCLTGLVFLLLCVLVWGKLKAIGWEEGSSRRVSFVPAAGRYEARLAALRERFAAERRRLGLSNEVEDYYEPPLGEPDCSSAGGGGGGSRSRMASTQSARHVPCRTSSKGAPVWKVNMAGLNLYVEDTPLWHSSPIGPQVEIRLSYNSLGGGIGAVGNKWQLNYETFISTTATGLQVTMPDGRKALYTDTGSGYQGPVHVFNTLRKVADNHFELELRDGTVYVYRDPPGAHSGVWLLAEIRDNHGQKLTMGYDAQGGLKTITDAVGQIITLFYESSGLLTKASDPYGRSASFEYDSSKNLTEITDMGGYATSFTYIQHPSDTYYLATFGSPGRSWAFLYEPPDNITDAEPYPAPGAAMGRSSRLTVTGPMGHREEFFSGQSIWHVNAKNYIPYSGPTENNSNDSVPKTSYSFNSNGGIATVVSPEGNSRNFLYDASGHITSATGGRRPLSLTYNAAGRPTLISEWSYQETAVEYAANGVDPVKFIDGLGTVALSYNDSHDITSITSRTGIEESITYNEYGQITSVTDPFATATRFNYDPKHLLNAITVAGQTIASYTYDSKGRERTHTNAAGLVRTFDYNNFDDITKITDPDGRSISFTYSDVIPRLITSIADRSGKIIQISHTPFGETESITMPGAGITRYERDPNGNLVRLVDPVGNVTNFSYDNDKRLVKKTYQDGSSTSFVYDEAGRITFTNNAREHSAIYQRIETGDPMLVIYLDEPYATPPVLYQYDPYNRRISMMDGAGTQDYQYDADSNVTGMTGPLTGDARSFTYDAKGRLTRYTVEAGQSVSYSYDSLGRVATVQNEAGKFTYAYMGTSPLVQKLTRPNGTYTEYRYDSLTRLKEVTNRLSGGEIINQFLYSHDDQDFRSTETITNAARVDSLPSESQTYGYNALNQLQTATSPERTFTYDADGNMTTGYTPAGHPFTATYDFENRLVSFHTLQAKTSYTYNGDGMLTSIKRDAGGGNISETRYVLSGILPLQERDHRNNVVREYTWGVHDGGGIGGLLGVNQAGKDYYYLYDGRGNVTALIDSSGAVVAAYTYDPFGNLLTKNGTVNQPYGFSTKPYDEVTGLIYFGYRFYAPSVGRWMTRDPLGEEVGINLYEFVGSNPINNIDPLGLQSASEPTLYESIVQALLKKPEKTAEEENCEDEPSQEKNLIDSVEEWLKKQRDTILSKDPQTGPETLEWINRVGWKVPVKWIGPADLAKQGRDLINKWAEKWQERMKQIEESRANACAECQ